MRVFVPMWRTRASFAGTFSLLLAAVLAAVLAACGKTGMSTSPSPGGGGINPVPAQRTDVVSHRNDAARTGQNLTESILTLTNVNPSRFGLQRFLTTDGKVDAEPLYLSGLTVQGAMHDVVFVATEKDSVYAFDADTGAVLWHVSVLAAGEDVLPPNGCDQVTPTIGVTATPVIDRAAGANGIIYIVAMSRTTASSTYHQRLHALDVTTGAEALNGPVDISATYPMLGGTTTFDPAQYEERAALLLSHGVIYTSWTSHCDIRPYSGWIIAYSQSTLARSAVFNAAPNSAGAGPAIWMSGGGPAADSAGNVYVLTANGAFETALDSNGFPDRGDYGNSFLKLSTAGGTLTVADYFTLYNAVSESSADQDLGSGGILLLPDVTDSGGVVRHLAVGAGKDGNLYVVSRDSLGKFSSSRNNIWQQLSGVLSGGIFSTPAYFNGAVYYGPVGAALMAFTVRNAQLSSAASSTTTNTFGYPGTSPAVSANGTSDGIIWAHENSDPAVLHAYDASNLGHELYNSSQAAGGRDHFGAGNKFITPMIADGKVFVGTQGGVAVFGLLN
jgi:outer membrane protein assembly factor BamB